jgi:hypothetical protein
MERSTMQTILAGHGELIANGEDLGRVEYKIIRMASAQSRSATGHIWGDTGALMQAFTSGKVILRPESGGKDMDIVVTSCTANEARISLNSDPLG